MPVGLAVCSPSFYYSEYIDINDKHEALGRFYSLISEIENINIIDMNKNLNVAHKDFAASGVMRFYDFLDKNSYSEYLDVVDYCIYIPATFKGAYDKNIIHLYDDFAHIVSTETLSNTIKNIENVYSTIKDIDLLNEIKFIIKIMKNFIVLSEENKCPIFWVE